jgi:hypothetical protein
VQINVDAEQIDEDLIWMLNKEEQEKKLNQI